jgi:hypothetical protein
MKVKFICAVAFALAVSLTASSQAVYNIYDFDVTAEGPWSDVANTTLTVPKVANGLVKLDGVISQAEYGGFKGVVVTPGDNAWILDFPGDRQWDGAEDNSFTFWLAHDDNFLYVAVDAKDEILNVDDEPPRAWLDDAVEIVIDALNDDYDVNTDSSQDPYGGHCYVTYTGVFSEWVPETEQVGTRWSTAVDWTVGPDGDIFVAGKEVSGGWTLEVKYNKRLFEDPEAGNKLDNGYKMGFNIGLDDDDMKGTGLNGSGELAQDLEIQYWWANRVRPKGYTPTVVFDEWGMTPEELAQELKNPNFFTDNFEMGIDSAGRLSHGGTGEIIFAAPASIADWNLY